MRILVVADIHYSLRQFDWLVEHGGDFDVVCIAGDLLEADSPVSLSAQAIVVRSYLDRLARVTRLLVCSGDHDLTGTDDTGERIAHWMAGLSEIDVVADGHSVEIDGTLFSVLPWWDGRNVRKEIAAQLARDGQREFTSWIWVHHAPPSGSPVAWSGQRYHGDNNLLEWIANYSPKVVFSGHVHDAPFVDGGGWVDRIDETLVFNMGRQTGETPAHIVLDTASDAAAWFSMEGVQKTALTGDPAPVAGLPDWIKDADRLRGSV